MKVTAVRVPIALLTDPSLTASAKVVWMVFRLNTPLTVGERPFAARIATRLGLSKETVRKALIQLSRSQWNPLIVASSTGPTRAKAAPAAKRRADPSVAKDLMARVPAELLLDESLSAEARVMYGLIQGVPGFRHPSGETTYAEVARLAGKDTRTVRRAIRDLVSAGWLEFTQANQLAPIRFRLRNPVAEERAQELEWVKRRIERAPFLGEALMREYLSLIVDSEDFEDDAAPGFLVNPLTGERLQFDRYYPPKVAFEFNGPQHYRATDLYSAEDAAKQRARDLIKHGICVEKGIQLIVVHAEDLALENMRRKVEGRLPVREDRDRRDHEELIDYLEHVSRAYRRGVRRRERSAAGRTIR